MHLRYSILHLVCDLKQINDKKKDIEHNKKAHLKRDDIFDTIVYRLADIMDNR
jgi:hypothetical protein